MKRDAEFSRRPLTYEKSVLLGNKQYRRRFSLNDTHPEHCGLCLTAGSLNNYKCMQVSVLMCDHYIPSKYGVPFFSSNNCRIND